MNEKRRQIFKLFKKNYELLAGKVYLTNNPGEAVEVLTRILSQSKATKAVLAPDLKALQKEIQPKLEGDVVELMQLERPEVVQRIESADIGISLVDFAIAETGTIAEVTTDDAIRLISSLPAIHIAFLSLSQIVLSLNEAAARLRKIYEKHPENCNVTFISGPSRTADIEMKLFLGVHGPQASHVIVREWK